MEELLQRLYAWCSVNHITTEPSEVDGIVQIPDFGRLLVLAPIDGKILEAGQNKEKEDNLYFVDGVEGFANPKEFDYMTFEWGKRWYYCKPKQEKDEFNTNRWVVDFNELKYVGKYTEDEDTYTHLGVHTEYEMLNGNGLAAYAKKAKFLQHKAIGMCDKNTLAGTLAFQLACAKEGVKSVLGASYDIAPNPDPSLAAQITYEVKLYVASWGGWQNLLQINKAVNVEYNGYCPEKLLLEHGKGLILVLGSKSHVNFGDISEVNKTYAKFKARFLDVFWAFDTTIFYDDTVDIKNLQIQQEYLTYYKNSETKALAPVLISDSYYPDKEHYPVKEALNKVARRAEDYSEDQFYKTWAEQLERLVPLFTDPDTLLPLLAELGINMAYIVERCTQFSLPIGTHHLPKYDYTPKGETKEAFFNRLLAQGFQERILTTDKDAALYYERLETEMQVIVGADFIDYFLILWDICQWCKQQDILVGPGRGSVGGSLLAYLLYIIDVDPIEHKLLFERFLNEARLSGERKKAADSLPDVDLDFESGKRDAVKQYIKQRFGTLHTCSIGTFTRLKLKGGLKDFGRARGLKFDFINFLTKKIDQQLDYTYKDFVLFAARDKLFKKFFQDYPDVVRVVQFAMNQPKAASIHASAVLVLPKQNHDGTPMDVYNWLPVRTVEGMLVSEWEGKYTDRAGYLKEDILGLNQLDKIQNIQKLLQQNYGKKINVLEIPLDDPATYKLFQKGYNEDVFQFNSFGLKDYSRQVRPDVFDDLVAMAAVYRPGPMSSNAHTDLALFKHGKKKPVFDYMLKDVTAETQGLYIYQEQMMMATVVLGGFTKVEADLLRTQIKKKEQAEMAKSGDKFVKGAVAQGCKEEEAKKIWEKLLAFSGYGFNRSHSAAYAMVSYWTQWFKAHYPLEFWTTTLQFASEHDIPYALSEMRKVSPHISVKPPSVNKSEAAFTCDPKTDSIYWSLQKITGFGEAVVSKLIEARGNKPFDGYDDFVARVPKAKVNKGHIEKLIMAGAFDEAEGIHRPQDRVQLLLHHCNVRGMKELPIDVDDAEVLDKPYFWTSLQKVLTGYGEIDYRAMLSALNKPKLLELYVTPEKLHKCKDYEEVVIAGVVNELIFKKTRKGDPFWILKLMNNNEVMTCMLWSDFITAYGDLLQGAQGKPIALKGKTRRESEKYGGGNTIYGSDKTPIYIL